MEGARLGPYHILAELGSGGMGKVYRAEVTRESAGLDAGTAVALKVIHAHLLEQEGFFQRFLREADIGRSVEHENVVRTYVADALVLDGAQQNFLVMEYVEGQTLRDLLAELERVPEELCRHIGREAAKGLSAIHAAGVVHRDLKPENVLITDQHVVKVMDLGVARLQDEAVRLSQTGAFVGSLEYAAPEQFRTADGEPDGRADLHSLGVMLYELATSQHPYRDEDASKVIHNILDVEPRKAGEVNPQLSPFFEEVVQTLIAKDRQQRFAAASDLVAVLEEGEKSDWWKERAKALRLETKRPLRRIRIPRETVLYGRDDDLAKLHALYDKAKVGGGQVLLIEGEAGIGKTRLVDEFVGRLRQEGEDINFLFGSYPPSGAATAAGAFSEAYREQFGAEGLEDTLVTYLKPTPILIPAFAAILRGETTPKDAEPLTKDSLQTVFVHATRGLAAERPTVILIDDLHFAPDDGRALFASLALAVPGHRILLIGTMRPGVPEEWTAGITRLEHAEERSLSRLGPKDLARLLGDAFRSERLAEELAYQISLKSDGNPFFAFEIIRGLREGQFISQRPDGSWVTTRVIEDIEVPSSVMDLVQARIRDLSEEERDLLDVASCCGFAFDPGLVARVVGLARLPALKQFGRIERRYRLIRSTGRTYTFDHHQVQEALYAGLHQQMLEEYHAAIAEALESRVGAAERSPRDLEGSLCVSLCEHLLKGACGQKALRYLEAALDYLEAGYLNQQVIELVDRALGVPDMLVGSLRVDMLLRKNDRLFLLGKRDVQKEVLAEAFALVGTLGDPGRVARVQVALGRLAQATGRNAAALAALQSAQDALGSLDDPQREADVVNYIGTTYFSVDRREEGLRHYERALALREQHGDLDEVAGSLINVGSACQWLGRIEEALEYTKRGTEMARRAGNLLFESNGLVNLSAIRGVHMGRSEEGLALAEEGLAIKRRIGDRRLERNALHNVAYFQWRCGQADAADEVAQQGLAVAVEVHDRRGEGAALHLLAQITMEFRDLNHARDLFTQALALHREVGAGLTEVDSLLGLAACLTAMDDRAAAEIRLRQALEVCDRVGSASLEAVASCQAAILDPERVGAARDALATHGPRLDPWTRVRAHHHLFRATADPEHLRHAKRILDHLVKHAPEEYRESMLKKVRLNREIMESWGEHGEG